MSSIALYNLIKDRNARQLSSGDIVVDEFLKTPKDDKRRGITLLIPLPGIGEKYRELVDQFRSIEPDQYYYPVSDLHVTIFTFISGTDGYVPNDAADRAYREITRSVLSGSDRIRLDFKGIVFSREAGILCGYDDDALIAIREAIRAELRKAGLPVHERYESESSHATFMRFMRRIEDPKAFDGTIRKNESKDLGRFEITDIRLVENDWYNSGPNRRLIERFGL